jgi:hypothetical protein
LEPLALTSQRRAQFIGDKLDDVDAYLSEKVGMEERAAFKKGIRQGFKKTKVTKKAVQ